MKKDFLDSINVKSPCGESWDEMTGSDTVRFCSHCAKDVHDLSAMTRQRAEKLVKDSNGKLCVRYVKTPQGKLLTAPPKFTQIKRQARIAAGALAASMALSTLAYAQGEPVKPKENQAQSVKNKSKTSETRKDFSVISGTVTDANKAVVPGAKVTLRDINNLKVRHTITDENGFYEFAGVEPDTYEIEVEFAGFEKFVLKNITVAENVKLEQSVVLDVAETTMGVVVIGEEVEDATETKINQNIQQKEILELPRNSQRFTMGLIASGCPAEKPKPEKSKKAKKKRN